MPSTVPGLKPRRSRASSSWRTSPPVVPGAMSRWVGVAPRRTKTGRPETDRSIWPSWNPAFGRGRLAISPTPPLTVEGAIVIGCGSPKRTVPRVTTSRLSTRDSTGTRIGDGSGGAVRAAISAGDWILEPAYQAPSAMPPTKPRTAHRTFTRLEATTYSLQLLTARGPCWLPRPSSCVPAGPKAVAHRHRSGAAPRITVALLFHLARKQLLLDAFLDWIEHLLLHLEA